jgi:hypothetical protein
MVEICGTLDGLEEQTDVGDDGDDDMVDAVGAVGAKIPWRRQEDLRLVGMAD